MPQALYADKCVEVLVCQLSLHEEETFAEHLLGELSDKRISTAGCSPHQLRQFITRCVGEKLDLFQIQGLQALNEFARPPCCGGCGTSPKKVVGLKSLTNLSPVPKLKIEFCGDGCPREIESACGKRKLVSLRIRCEINRRLPGVTQTAIDSWDSL